MNSLHRAEFTGGRRYPQGGHRGVLEIPDKPAAHAHVVVMPIEVGVEAGAVAVRPTRRDQSQVVEEPQGPVDRVERDGRQPGLHRPVQAVSGWVFGAGGDLPEDLEALVRELDASLAEAVMQSLETTLDLGEG